MRPESPLQHQGHELPGATLIKDLDHYFDVQPITIAILVVFSITPLSGVTNDSVGTTTSDGTGSLDDVCAHVCGSGGTGSSVTTPYMHKCQTHSPTTCSPTVVVGPDVYLGVG